MSNYVRPAQHPETGLWYIAEFMDDYFGKHEYGVRFPDEKVYPVERRPNAQTLVDDYFPVTDEHDNRKTYEGWAVALNLELTDPDIAFEKTFARDIHSDKRALTREEFDQFLKNCEHRVISSSEGKETITTKRPDGSQDVEIKVTRLNLENRTPEDDKAEAVILEAMTRKEVRVVVLHKPSNDFASFKCKLPEVRKNGEEVVRKHMFRAGKPKPHEEAGMFEVLKGDYVIVEYDADQIRVSSL